MKFNLPPLRRIRWQSQHRIIASKYPPVDLFERLGLTPHELQALYALQARTNPRLRETAGDLSQVRPDDVVTGPGASVVMAAFTHIGFSSRYSDGSYGVYYAARRLETAIRETVFHRERDALDAKLEPESFNMRVYKGTVKKPMYDIRDKSYAPLHRADLGVYRETQAFAAELRRADIDAWGMVYPSARHVGGDCLAVFRPPGLSLPKQCQHLAYEWNGSKIVAVSEKSAPILLF